MRPEISIWEHSAVSRTVTSPHGVLYILEDSHASARMFYFNKCKGMMNKTGMEFSKLFSACLLLKAWSLHLMPDHKNRDTGSE